MAVAKPQNMPACPDGTGDLDLLTALKLRIKERDSKPGNVYLGLVHRLDRPTGGAMVFAKTSKAASRLCEAIKADEFERTYYAITVGRPKEKSMLGLTHYLYKDTDKNMVYSVPMATEGAKKAVLDYRILEERGPISLLEIKLHTGRGHQIRVQMQAIGAPLFGDRRYGRDKSPAGYGLALWATELRIPHPVKSQRMVFRVYPPIDETPWDRFDVARHLSVDTAAFATDIPKLERPS